MDKLRVWWCQLVAPLHLRMSRPSLCLAFVKYLKKPFVWIIFFQINGCRSSQLIIHPKGWIPWIPEPTYVAKLYCPILRTFFETERQNLQTFSFWRLQLISCGSWMITWFYTKSPKGHMKCILHFKRVDCISIYIDIYLASSDFIFSSHFMEITSCAIYIFE